MKKLTFKEKRFLFFAAIPQDLYNKIKFQEAAKKKLEESKPPEQRNKEAVIKLTNLAKHKREQIKEKFEKFSGENLESLRPAINKLKEIEDRLDRLSKDMGAGKNIPKEVMEKLRDDMIEVLNIVDNSMIDVEVKFAPSTPPQ